MIDNEGQSTVIIVLPVQKRSQEVLQRDILRIQKLNYFTPPIGLFVSITHKPGHPPPFFHHQQFLNLLSKQVF